MNAVCVFKYDDAVENMILTQEKHYFSRETCTFYSKFDSGRLAAFSTISWHQRRVGNVRRLSADIGVWSSFCNTFFDFNSSYFSWIQFWFSPEAQLDVSLCDYILLLTEFDWFSYEMLDFPENYTFWAVWNPEVFLQNRVSIRICIGFAENKNVVA